MSGFEPQGTHALTTEKESSMREVFSEKVSIDRIRSHARSLPFTPETPSVLPVFPVGEFHISR